MAWFKFSKDFDFRPDARSVVAYKKGQHVNINQTALKAALEAGAGEETAHEPQTGDAQDGSQEVRTAASKEGTPRDETGAAANTTSVESKRTRG